MTAKKSGGKPHTLPIKQATAPTQSKAPQKVAAKAPSKLTPSGSNDVAKKTSVSVKPSSSSTSKIRHNETKQVPWTDTAARRIQRAETVKEGGVVRKGSFAAFAMSEAAKEAARKSSK